MTHSDKETWQQWPDEQDQPTISDPSVDLNIAETPTRSGRSLRPNAKSALTIATYFITK
jgi:hypothetical protein